jgi:hypothetical protein
VDVAVEFNARSGCLKEHVSAPNDLSPSPVVSSGNCLQQSSPTSNLASGHSRSIDSLGHIVPQVNRDKTIADGEADMNRQKAFLSDRASLIPTSRVAVDPALNATPGHSIMFNRKDDGEHIEITDAELEALDYLMINPTSTNPFTDQTLSWARDETTKFMPQDPIMAESPDMYATYYPNPAYKDLHTVLHHHMVETAKNTALTRQATPEAIHQDSSAALKEPAGTQNAERTTQHISMSLIGPLKGAKLTNRRELELWQNYLGEVAV